MQVQMTGKKLDHGLAILTTDPLVFSVCTLTHKFTLEPTASEGTKIYLPLFLLFTHSFLLNPLTVVDNYDSKSDPWPISIPWLTGEAWVSKLVDLFRRTIISEKTIMVRNNELLIL